MTILITGAILIGLIGINALYVAAEFSSVSVRRSRLAQMTAGGNRVAAYMLATVEDPHKLDVLVAACQVGITVSSLVVGFYGQAQLLAAAQPWIEQLGGRSQAIAQSLSAIVVLLLLTTVQVVLGELVPKNLGLQYPERLAVLTARPIRASIWLFRPLIWLFNGSGRLILRALGVQAVGEHTHIHSPDEIVMLVEESAAGGLLDADERRLLVNTLHLRDLTARHVMIPRNHMLAGDVSRPSGELLTLLAQSPFSRLPLYEGTIDNIIGVVHLKDLMGAHYSHPSDEEESSTALPADANDVRPLLRPVPYAPDSVEVGDVMSLMQGTHHNLIIIVDEYGGTAGMITFEDLVEEIIGEFEDEFDRASPRIQLKSTPQDDPGQPRIHVRGDVLVDDLMAFLDLELPNGNVNTVGGLVLWESVTMPKPGDEILVGKTLFRVEKLFQHGVAAVSFAATREQAARFQ